MIHLRKYRSLVAMLIAIAMMSLMLACGSSDDDDDAELDDEETETVAATAYKPSGNEGSITGTISFEGTPPEPKLISMDADAACAAANPNPVTEEVVVKDGKLANVFVYVKEGKLTEGGRSVSNLSFDVPSAPVTLDQKGCQYTPHVLGIMTKQQLRVLNSDQTAHNVHPLPKSNQEWNQSQSPGAPPLEKTFTRPETLIPVKCNQHPWMKSYVGVLAHPLYAVSADGGQFEIKGVPPGTYTVVAWHEKLGEKTQQVAVGAKESKTQDYSFAGSGTASLNGGSLTVLPDLEFPMAGGKH